jgi:hypothetical protein
MLFIIETDFVLLLSGETFGNALDVCLSITMQRYEIISENASDLPTLTLENLATSVLDRSYGNR